MESKIQETAISLKDGSYQAEVSLSGGSGRASVTSPAKLIVKNQQAVILTEWSSSNYDYMTVNEKTYYPVNTEGNSVFEIPVIQMDVPFEVVADTTAMGKPHEVTYSLTIDSSTICMQKKSAKTWYIGAAVLGAICIGLVIGRFFTRKRENK